MLTQIRHLSISPHAHTVGSMGSVTSNTLRCGDTLTTVVPSLPSGWVAHLHSTHRVLIRQFTETVLLHMVLVGLTCFHSTCYTANWIQGYPTVKPNNMLIFTLVDGSDTF